MGILHGGTIASMGAFSTPFPRRIALARACCVFRRSCAMVARRTLVGMVAAFADGEG